jgi:hypothetical protein
MQVIETQLRGCGKYSEYNNALAKRCAEIIDNRSIVKQGFDIRISITASGEKFKMSFYDVEKVRKDQLDIIMSCLQPDLYDIKYTPCECKLELWMWEGGDKANAKLKDVREGKQWVQPQGLHRLLAEWQINSTIPVQCDAVLRSMTLEIMNMKPLIPKLIVETKLTSNYDSTCKIQEFVYNIDSIRYSFLQYMLSRFQNNLMDYAIVSSQGQEKCYLLLQVSVRIAPIVVSNKKRMRQEEEVLDLIEEEDQEEEEEKNYHHKNKKRSIEGIKNSSQRKKGILGTIFSLFGFDTKSV